MSVAARVKVEAAGLPKSTWKRQRGHVALNPTSTNGFGAPAGGWFEPSRSAGKIASLLLLKIAGSVVVMAVPGEPVSIAARLNANGCGPRYAVPAALKTLSLM